MKEKHLVGRNKYNYVRSFFIIYSSQAVINLGPEGRPKVLLVKRKEHPARGKWWIPGGGVFKAETPERAILRIAERETGLKCRIAKKLPRTRETFKNDPDTRDGISDYISDNFLLVPVKKGEKIHLDRTSSEYRFIEKIDRNLHPFVKCHLKNSGLFNSGQIMKKKRSPESAANQKYTYSL